jgi:hypothetical protein
MPNTKDLGEDTQLRFLLCGYPGSGKTTQALTLPGKKFAYVFDPNALQALRGADIDYEIFLPDAQDVDLSAKTLKSGIGDKPRRRKEPLTYMNWEKDFDDKYDSGFFDNYDWVVFDSFTNFLDIIMDRFFILMVAWGNSLSKRTGPLRLIHALMYGACWLGLILAFWRLLILILSRMT